MKGLNRMIPVLTLVFGISLISVAAAQDSTQTRAQVQKRNKAKVTAQAKKQNDTRAQNQVKGQPGQPMHHGNRFVDKDGDGYNDNAPDHDGDGIPNGLDPDYTGPKMRAGRGMHGFIDLDGDGINDNMMNRMNRATGGKGHGAMPGMKGQKGGHGPGDGTGNQGVRPQDGTGHGVKAGAGSDNCDGTGPKGKANRGGKSN
ncbi:MAG: hypothetical protein Q9P90_05635 [candidate division KSB1 bacterium]|nr:hypothetical protein [candidate division KSB1 bacterium]